MFRQQATESIRADYSTLMPSVARSLLDNRKRYERRAAEMSEEKLFEIEPKALGYLSGYLRPREGYRLFDQRQELCRWLTEDVRANKEWLLETLQYPLAT